MRISLPHSNVASRSNTGTKKAFTADGYYKTGDLVELPTTGTIRVIGRRKHAIKLSKAQWVHPGALEIVFLRADVVEQIYVSSF